MLVTVLQKNCVRVHTHNSSFITTSSAHYKDKVFPDGEFLHSSIKDAAQCITSTPIKPNNITRLKCDLGFLDEFPE